MQVKTSLSSFRHSIIAGSMPILSAPGPISPGAANRPDRFFVIYGVERLSETISDTDFLFNHFKWLQILFALRFFLLTGGSGRSKSRENGIQSRIAQRHSDKKRPLF
jgi:hypothetical protein